VSRGDALAIVPIPSSVTLSHSHRSIEGGRKRREEEWVRRRREKEGEGGGGKGELSAFSEAS